MNKGNLAIAAILANFGGSCRWDGCPPCRNRLGERICIATRCKLRFANVEGNPGFASLNPGYACWPTGRPSQRHRHPAGRRRERQTCQPAMPEALSLGRTCCMSCQFILSPNGISSISVLRGKPLFIASHPRHSFLFHLVPFTSAMTRLRRPGISGHVPSRRSAALFRGFIPCLLLPLLSALPTSVFLFPLPI